MNQLTIHNSTLINTDCMEYMQLLPGKHFDLAICDPPYGIGPDWKKRNGRNHFLAGSYKNDCIPGPEYFSEIHRVSKDVIIWGYNYFTKHLGSTNYLICWDKKSSKKSVVPYSKFELAYTTKRVPANLVSIPWNGGRKGAETGLLKIHPHQKPIELYEWILENYAAAGQKIFDSNMGSGSSAIACNNLGFDYVGCEIDPYYFTAACNRIAQYAQQERLFA